jgi:dTDP-L-rhamnose 4-epimerase
VINMSKVLVTGGAGFIGSHTVDELIAQGYEVVVMDNYERQVHLGNKPFYENKKAKYIRGDIRHRKHWEKCLNGCEYVIHLAGAVGVGQSFWQSRKYFSVNTIGTTNLYDILIHDKSIASKIQKIVVASSKSIYGEGAYMCKQHGLVYPNPRPLEQLQRHDWEVKCPLCGEDLTPIATDEKKPPQNLSPYANSKYDTERISMNYSSLLKIPTVAFRYYNAYGPRQSLNNPYTGVLAIFISRLKNGHPPIVFEDGHQIRDFINVIDIARINVMALEHGDGVYNVGTGKHISLLNAIKTISDLMGSSIQPLITNDFRPGDNRHDFADASKLISDFGFYRFSNFNHGVESLVEWALKTKSIDIVDKAEKERKSYLKL